MTKPSHNTNRHNTSRHNSNRQNVKRMAARLAALQSLYAAHVCEKMPAPLAAYTDEHGHQTATDDNLRDLLIQSVGRDKKKYDTLITANLYKKKLPSLELLLLLILRCGCAELVACQDTATAVVISSYVELCKEFYEGKEVGFVNAVLDNIAKTLKS